LKRYFNYRPRPNQAEAEICTPEERKTPEFVAIGAS
jgi:hypothetical protein